MAGPAGLRERRKAQTRDRLLAAAVEAFVERGYDATTVDQIAAAADVARATAFNYFRRKEDFVVALIDKRREEAKKALEQAHEAGANTVSGIRDALSALTRFYEDDPNRNGALLRCWLRAGGPLIPGWYDSGRVFAQAIRAGQRRGDVKKSTDPDVIGLLILDAYVGTLYRWAAAPEKGLAEAVLAEVEPVLQLL